MRRPAAVRGQNRCLGRIEAALRGRNAVTVLTTSREPLAVSGERVVPVPSLSPSDAVDLFCDRATAVDASLEFGDAERDTIDAICTRLDGIPLAIELAAARMRSLTSADLLDRLADRFKVLRGDRRNAVERHQTLRATVTWSYQLLSEPERAVFDRLSVFAGGFDPAAAEAVCAGAAVDRDDVDDLFAGLVDKSLVVVDRTDRSARYRLLVRRAGHRRGRGGPPTGAPGGRHHARLRHPGRGQRRHRGP
jgi:predicted ATPase